MRNENSVETSETESGQSYIDTTNTYTLTLSLDEFSIVTGLATFRINYVLDESEGQIGFGSAFGFYPTPTVRELSDNRLAVGFLNPATSGAPSIKVLSYSSDLTHSDESPVSPVVSADFSLESADPNAAGSIVLDVVTTETGALIGYTGLWTGAQNQRVALMESFGKPVGVVSNVDCSDLDVALSATVKVSSSLFKGTTYYASTDGTLYAASTTTTDNYILANDNTVVISKDAMVGVAVSDEKLVVTV